MVSAAAEQGGEAVNHDDCESCTRYFSRATRAEAAVGQIAALDLEGLTYENTFLALEGATEELTVAWGKVTHLQAVADAPALREAQNAMLPKVSAFYAKIPLNGKVAAVAASLPNEADVRQTSKMLDQHTLDRMKYDKPEGQQW